LPNTRYNQVEKVTQQLLETFYYNGHLIQKQTETSQWFPYWEISATL